MTGSPFFSNPYGLIPGKSPGSKGAAGGRPKKVKTTFAPIDTKDGFVMPKVQPEVMKKAEEDIKNGQFPPALRTTRLPARSRALQTKTNESIAKAMANSKNVRNSQ